MKNLELKVRPPILTVAAFAIAGLLAYLFPIFDISGLKLPVMAAPLWLAASYFGISGVLAFKKARTSPDPTKPEKSSYLVKTGVYKLSRNPMYFALFLGLLGWGFFLGNLLSLLIPFLFVIYLTRFQIKVEERVLAELFGEEYTTYQNDTRRWI